jgi:hypothetical protein
LGVSISVGCPSWTVNQQDHKFMFKLFIGLFQCLIAPTEIVVRLIAVISSDCPSPFSHPLVLQMILSIRKRECGITISLDLSRAWRSQIKMGLSRFHLKRGYRCMMFIKDLFGVVILSMWLMDQPIQLGYGLAGKTFPAEIHNSHPHTDAWTKPLWSLIIEVQIGPVSKCNPAYTVSTRQVTTTLTAERFLC